jgi:hypothetical protein
LSLNPRDLHVPNEDWPLFLEVLVRMGFAHSKFENGKWLWSPTEAFALWINQGRPIGEHPRFHAAYEAVFGGGASDEGRAV